MSLIPSMTTYDYNRLYLLLGQAAFTAIAANEQGLEFLPAWFFALNNICLAVNLAALAFITEPKKAVNEDEREKKQP